jgi:hypothetical protein
VKGETALVTLGPSIQRLGLDGRPALLHFRLDFSARLVREVDILESKRTLATKLVVRGTLVIRSDRSHIRMGNHSCDTPSRALQRSVERASSLDRFIHNVIPFLSNAGDE